MQGNYELVLGDCIEKLDELIKRGERVDLTVTSPPYDDIRTYNGVADTWNFETFKKCANKLYEITRDGGIVVWVVGDATVNGGESGSSFRQALYFQEIGFKIHDTMIFEKNSSAFPAARNSKRYTQIFEYMFVFVKGKIRKDISLIADKPNKWAGWTNWGNNTQYDKEGNLHQTNNIKPVPDYSLRNNIWKYTVGFNEDNKKFCKHPAVFPEQLALDHIKSWSVDGDTVLDPFMGSGTTGKMALLNGRKFIGIELNEPYHEGAKKRIEYYINKKE